MINLLRYEHLDILDHSFHIVNDVRNVEFY